MCAPCGWGGAGSCARDALAHGNRQPTHQCARSETYAENGIQLGVIPNDPLSLRQLVHRQVQDHGRPTPLDRGQPQLSAVVLDDLLDDAQPEAGAGYRLIRGIARSEEPGEQVSLVLGRDADPTVLAGDENPAGLVVQYAHDGHDASSATELDGVGEDVENRPLKRCLVAQDDGLLRTGVDLE